MIGDYLDNLEDIKMTIVFNKKNEDLYTSKVHKNLEFTSLPIFLLKS
jgi:hypothetical protein